MNDPVAVSTTPEVNPSAPVPVVVPAKSKEQIAAECAAKEAEQKARFERIKAEFAAKGSLVDVTATKFFFKKVEQLDANDKPTGIVTKRATVELPLVSPSYEGIVKILENAFYETKDAAGNVTGTGTSKEYNLLMEAVRDIPAARARELLNENEKYDGINFPIDMLTWEAIANLPASERRGTGIAKETWEEMVKDYVLVMPSILGQDLDRVKKAAYIFATKFATVKTVKPILSRCKELLGIYAENTTRGEEFADCIEFLLKKADTWLAADEQKMADAL